MAKKKETVEAHQKIVVGIPNLQDQLRLVDRVAESASEPDVECWKELGILLAELYSQLQRQKQVTVYRFGNRSRSKTA